MDLDAPYLRRHLCSNCVLYFYLYEDLLGERFPIAHPTGLLGTLMIPVELYFFLAINLSLPLRYLNFPRYLDTSYIPTISDISISERS